MTEHDVPNWQEPEPDHWFLWLYLAMLATPMLGALLGWWAE